MKNKDAPAALLALFKPMSATPKQDEEEEKADHHVSDDDTRDGLRKLLGNLYLLCSAKTETKD